MAKVINSIIWSDLKDSLLIGADGELSRVYNVDSVKNSIRNILGTVRGERVFLCEFGGCLLDFVFDPINNSLLDRLSDRIKSDIETWDNRVSIVGIDFNSYPDQNEVNITVRFQIKGYTESYSTVVKVNQ